MAHFGNRQAEFDALQIAAVNTAATWAKRVTKIAFFLVLAAPCFAEPAKPFEKVEGCTWKADKWNDGDSFHVITPAGKKEIVARLYFVDAPESGTGFMDRSEEQAAYFGISKEEAKLLSDEATAFTERYLSKPFTIWTRWNSAMGRSALGRVYCIVITSEGYDLGDLLVQNGLARIYGVKTPLYDGRDSAAYISRLKALEGRAKKERRGGWKNLR